MAMPAKSPSSERNTRPFSVPPYPEMWTLDNPSVPKALQRASAEPTPATAPRPERATEIVTKEGASRAQSVAADGVVPSNAVAAEDIKKHKQLDLYAADIARLQQENKQLQLRLQAELAEQRQKYERESSKQRAQIQKFESELQEAQLTSFAEMTSSGPAPDEDSSFVHDIRLLHKNIGTWAKQHGLASTQQMRTVLDENDGSLASCSSAAGANISLFYVESQPSIDPLPALFLAASVAYDIYTKLFDDPFFFVDSCSQETDNKKGKALREAMVQLNKCMS